MSPWSPESSQEKRSREGVLTESSIAFSVARRAQEEGAQVILSSYGRVRRITEHVAARLPHAAPVIELDVTSEADLSALAGRVSEHTDGLDGVGPLDRLRPALRPGWRVPGHALGRCGDRGAE